MSELPHIIGLCGDIGSGKDTVAYALQKHLGYEPISFAFALKDAVSSMFPWVPSRHFFGTQEEKAELLFVGGVDQEWTGRKLLEEVGQHMRGIMPDIWIKAAMEQVDRNLAYPWVVTDVRHVNEIQAIRSRRGVIWQVVRTGGAPAERTGHVSDEAWRIATKDAILQARSGDVAGLQAAAVEQAQRGRHDG
jgi:hypothetical protein